MTTLTTQRPLIDNLDVLTLAAELGTYIHQLEDTTFVRPGRDWQRAAACARTLERRVSYIAHMLKRGAKQAALDDYVCPRVLPNEQLVERLRAIDSIRTKLRAQLLMLSDLERSVIHHQEKADAHHQDNHAD
jgi:hypothetical protein